MIREISAVELRKNLGGILNLVDLKHEAVIIRRADQAVAVLIDINTYYEKVSCVSPQSSLRDFSNSIKLELDGYKFNRNEANDRSN